VRITGHPLNLVAVSKKAQSMELSSIAPADLDRLRNDVNDVLADGEGGPRFSREVFRFTSIRLGVEESQHRAKLHGIRPELMETMLAGFRLVEGDLPDPDDDEMIVGPRIARDLGIPEEMIEIDETVLVGDTMFTITGKFEAPGTLVEHWFLTDPERLRLAVRRSDWSFARMQLRDGVDLDALAKRLELDERYELRVLRETDYFADFAAGFGHFRTFSLLLALVLAIGGVLTGMNTMHNAVSGRIREIGVLRVLGFGRFQVLLAFLLEVMLLCAAAGVIGCALGWLSDGLPMKLPFAAAFPWPSTRSPSSRASPARSSWASSVCWCRCSARWPRRPCPR
jgi:putative ABC transport system permease protein